MSVEDGGGSVFLLPVSALMAIFLAVLTAVILTVVAVGLVLVPVARLVSAALAFFAAFFGSGNGLLAVLVRGSVVDWTTAWDATGAGILVSFGCGVAAFDLRY